MKCKYCNIDISNDWTLKLHEEACVNVYNQYDEIKKLYLEENISVKNIAKKLNCSVHILRYYLSEEIKTKNKKLNDTLLKQNRVKSVISWRQRTKIKSIEYKGGKCILCGYDKCKTSLSFHHLNPKEKDFTISGKSFSWDKLKLELDKCVLLCLNCHQELHDNYNKNNIEFIDNFNLVVDEHKNTIIYNEFIPEKIINKCICNKEISKDATLCVDCSKMKYRKVERPPYEELLKLVYENNYLAVGRMFGVADNTIRKWIKNYEKLK